MQAGGLQGSGCRKVFIIVVIVVIIIIIIAKTRPGELDRLGE